MGTQLGWRIGSAVRAPSQVRLLFQGAECGRPGGPLARSASHFRFFLRVPPLKAPKGPSTESGFAGADPLLSLFEVLLLAVLAQVPGAEVADGALSII
jgi:hypothetical protein